MSKDYRTKSKRGGGCFFQFLLLVIVVGILGFLGFYWAGNKGLDITKKAIGVFKPKMIVNSFTEWRELQVQGNEGNILEVATATATEEFSSESSVEMFGRPLLSKISRISVPATYRFHIDLTGAWEIMDDGNRIIIMAPPLQPSLPVAFDTSQMEKKTDAGWGKYIPTNAMAELEKTITEGLGERAGDPETLKKVRTKARRSIAKFLQSWLMSEEQWEKGMFEELVVLFPGESPADIDPVLEVGNPEILGLDDDTSEVMTPVIVEVEEAGTEVAVPEEAVEPAPGAGSSGGTETSTPSQSNESGGTDGAVQPEEFRKGE